MILVPFADRDGVLVEMQRGGLEVPVARELHGTVIELRVDVRLNIWLDYLAMLSATRVLVVWPSTEISKGSLGAGNSAYQQAISPFFKLIDSARTFHFFAAWHKIPSVLLDNLIVAFQVLPHFDLTHTLVAYNDLAVLVAHFDIPDEATSKALAWRVLVMVWNRCLGIVILSAGLRILRLLTDVHVVGATVVELHACFVALAGSLGAVPIVAAHVDTLQIMPAWRNAWWCWWRW